MKKEKKTKQTRVLCTQASECVTWFYIHTYLLRVFFIHFRFQVHLEYVPECV